MSDSPAVRPVWLTREQRNWLAHLEHIIAPRHSTAVSASIVAAWDAAPADATEDVRRVIEHNGSDPEFSLAEAWAVLAALGAPQ